jgi:hypothetical protein
MDGVKIWQRLAEFYLSMARLHGAAELHIFAGIRHGPGIHGPGIRSSNPQPDTGSGIRRSMTGEFGCNGGAIARGRTDYMITALSGTNLMTIRLPYAKRKSGPSLARTKREETQIV